MIDVYYKLFWLHKAGVKIHLHCFYSSRKPAKELEELCEEVFYYKRKTGLLSNLSLLPYTVKSRQSEELKKNLLKNDFPILFEVLHTCFLIKDEAFKNRIKIYRHSNIEHDYYLGLSNSERNFLKKIYLKIEAWKLKRFEKIITHANYILSVNAKDAAYFKNNYSKVHSIFLPSFHQGFIPQKFVGTQKYILFHGNLSISENYEAALWLIENVFSKVNHQVIIAGLNPPQFLKEKILEHPHISLKENLAETDMAELVANAHIHLLFTHQATGLKLKLLNVLHQGKFIILNDKMLDGTGIAADDGILIASDKEEFIKAINNLYTLEFTTELVAKRKLQLNNFDCEMNTERLVKLL